MAMEDTRENLPPVVLPQRYNFVLSSRFWVLVGVVTTVVVVAVLLLPIPFLTAVVLAVVVAFGIHFYATTMRKVAARRRDKPRPTQITVHESWVPNHVVSDVLHTLVRLKDPNHQEDVIWLLTRKHGFYLVTRFVPVVFGLVASLIAAAVIGTIHIEYTQEVGKEVTRPNGETRTVVRDQLTQLDIPMYWFFLAIACILAVLALLTWVSWSCSYFMVTNINVVVLRVPPIWLPFMESSPKRTKLVNIIQVNQEDDVLGQRFGYGTLHADTPAQEDDSIANVTYLPRHDDVIDLLESAMSDARRSAVA